jgi:hypothetical protein
MKAVLLAALFLVNVANAQEHLVPSQTAPATAIVASISPVAAPESINIEPVANAVTGNSSVVPDAPSTRKFWTLENKINFSIFTAELAADAITTQRGLNNGMREANPLARPFVTRGAGGQAAASVLGLGLAVGTAYWLHHTHHYKAERIAVRIMVAAEGIAVGQNIAVLR